MLLTPKNSLCMTFLYLAQFLEEKDVETASSLFKKSCLLFGKVQQANERYSKVFRSLILQQILFGRFSPQVSHFNLLKKHNYVIISSKTIV